MRIRESIATALDSMTLADLAPQEGIAMRVREFRSLVQLPQVQAECADQHVVSSAAKTSPRKKKTPVVDRSVTPHPMTEQA
jgi:hypothetical protein